MDCDQVTFKISSNLPTSHTPEQSSRDFNIQLLSPEIRGLVAPENSFKPRQDGMKKKNPKKRGRKRSGHPKASIGTLLSPTDSFPTAPIRTVVSSVSAPEGGAIVCSPDGNSQIRKYDRFVMIRIAHSPYTILPPVCMKDIVMNFPEILPRFPHRHGVNLCSCYKET